MDDAEKIVLEAKLQEARDRAKELSDREYKFRQALLFYAKPSNWQEYMEEDMEMPPGYDDGTWRGSSQAYEDSGERARKALKG